MTSKPHDTETQKVDVRFHETASAAVSYVELGYDDKAMWVGAEFITLTGGEAERLVSMEIAGYFIVRKQDGIDFVPFNPTGKIPAFVPPKDDP